MRTLAHALAHGLKVVSMGWFECKGLQLRLKLGNVVTGEGERERGEW